MPTDSLRTSIQSLTQSFAEQLEQLVRQAAVEQVTSALGGLGVSTPARRGRPRKTGTTGRKPGRPAGSGKRTAGDMDAMQERLLSHVKANPGQRGEQIAAAMKSDVMMIRLPMKKLIAARKVTTKGERRGMMYFPGSGAGVGRPTTTTQTKTTRPVTKTRRATTAKKAKRAKKTRRGRKATATTKPTPTTQTIQKAA